MLSAKSHSHHAAKQPVAEQQLTTVGPLPFLWLVPPQIKTQVFVHITEMLLTELL